MKFHPDFADKRFKSAAEDKFKAINEAYSVLSDPKMRNIYDRGGHRALEQGFGGYGFQATTVDFNHSSRRQIIKNKLDTRVNFDINMFARELGVEVKNLRKILEVMIKKGLVHAKIQSGIFEHMS